MCNHVYVTCTGHTQHDCGQSVHFFLARKKVHYLTMDNAVSTLSDLL